MTMAQRLAAVMNAHDGPAMASLFAADYASAQPVHPGRAFRGRAQVLENWTAVFRGVPDFVAELVATSVAGDVECTEWDWRGRHIDGTTFHLRGVMILTVRHDLVADARLYLEPVDAAGEGIAEAVADLYRPPPRIPERRRLRR